MDDMTDVKRVGSGICGEVYRMIHKPSTIAVAAKVQYHLTVHLITLYPLSLSLYPLSLSTLVEDVMAA